MDDDLTKWDFPPFMPPQIKFEFSGLQFVTYFGLRKLAKIETFLKWFKYSNTNDPNSHRTSSDRLKSSIWFTAVQVFKHVTYV